MTCVRSFTSSPRAATSVATRELEIADAELLHHVVTLSLRELAVQGISIVAITDKLIGDLLSLTTRAAEDDTVDIGVVVGDTLQSRYLWRADTT